MTLGQLGRGWWDELSLRNAGFDNRANRFLPLRSPREWLNLIIIIIVLIIFIFIIIIIIIVVVVVILIIVLIIIIIIILIIALLQFTGINCKIESRASVMYFEYLFAVVIATFGQSSFPVVGGSESGQVIIVVISMTVVDADLEILKSKSVAR